LKNEFYEPIPILKNFDFFRIFSQILKPLRQEEALKDAEKDSKSMFLEYRD